MCSVTERFPSKLFLDLLPLSPLRCLRWLDSVHLGDCPIFSAVRQSYLFPSLYISVFFAWPSNNPTILTYSEHVPLKLTRFPATISTSSLLPPFSPGFPLLDFGPFGPLQGTPSFLSLYVCPVHPLGARLFPAHLQICISPSFECRCCLCPLLTTPYLQPPFLSVPLSCRLRPWVKGIR